MSIQTIPQHSASNLNICGSFTIHELRQVIHTLRVNGMDRHLLPSFTQHADIRVSFGGATGNTLIEYFDGHKDQVVLKASSEGYLEVDTDLLGQVAPSRNTVGASAYLVKLLQFLLLEQSHFGVHTHRELLNSAARKTCDNFYDLAHQVVETSKKDIILYPKAGNGPIASAPAAPILLRREGDLIGIYNNTSRQLIMRVARQQVSIGNDYHQGNMNIAVHTLVSSMRPMLLDHLALIKERGKEFHSFFRDLESHIHWVTQKEVAVFGQSILREPGSPDDGQLKFILAENFTYIHPDFRLERRDGHWKITFRHPNPKSTAQLAIYYNTAEDKMRIYAPTYDYLWGRNWNVPEVLNLRTSIFNSFSTEINTIALNRVSTNAAELNITPEEFKTVTKAFAIYLSQQGGTKLNLPEYIELIRPFLKDLPHA